MEQFVGVWAIKDSDNFDAYMKAIGVNIALRKLGQVAKPTLTISVEGNKMKMNSVSAVRNISMEMTLDEEFDETTPDGRKCKTKYTMNGNKLVQHQTWSGKSSTITRYINDGELTMELVVGDVHAKRTYTKK